jgi:outer membrane protein OmpA-like peptidoglycan-associated protein
VTRALLLRRALAAAAALSVAVGLGGCTQDSGDSGTPKYALAIVTGSRNNTPPPSLNGAAVGAQATALGFDSFLASVVVADGQPSENHALLVVNAKNGTARNQQRIRNRQILNLAIKTAKARTPETDLLSALVMAARAISSVRGPHTILVVDSGLSTAGQLSFSHPGMLDAVPEEVADSLAKAHELPDLSGDDVVFEGLGDVAVPQARLDEADRQKLIAIWTAVAKAAHAKSVTIEQTPLQGTPPAGLPRVTLVPIPPRVTCTGDTVVLTSRAVAFKPDSAELLDPAAASAILKPIAQQIVNGDLRAKLTGTTANVGDKAGQRQLSLQRAGAVMALLASLKVRVERMNAVGVGSEFDGYVQDHDSAGNLIPWAAAANRKVVVQLIGGQVTC